MRGHILGPVTTSVLFFDERSSVLHLAQGLMVCNVLLLSFSAIPWLWSKGFYMHTCLHLQSLCLLKAYSSILLMICVATSSELLIHHNSPPREHRRAARDARDWVLCGRCAGWQHKGWDMLLCRGRDQVQPHVSGRGIGTASSSVTYITSGTLMPVQRHESSRNKKLQRMAGELNLFETGSFPLSTACMSLGTWLETLVACRTKYL